MENSLHNIEIIQNKDGYTIGEVAQIIGEEIYNLRYWESELGIEIKRNENKQRVYTLDNINTFRWIKELRQNDGLSLKAIEKLLIKNELRNEEVAASTEVVPLNNNSIEIQNLVATFTGVINELSKVNKDLINKIDNMNYKIDTLERLEELESERDKKFNTFIEEWREHNRKESFLQRVFSMFNKSNKRR